MILLGKVGYEDVYPDCKHIPGDGIDDGETNEQALIREIQEEVEVDLYENNCA